MTGMQSFDVGFPSFSDGMSMEEKLEEVLSYVYSLRETLKYVLTNLGKENFNATEFDNITSPIIKQISDTENNLMQVKITADSAKVTASDAYGKAQSVELTVDGFTVTGPSGETTIDGNKIKSGTIEGVTLVSKNAAGAAAVVEDGEIRLYADYEGFIWAGSLGYAYPGVFRLQNLSSGVPLKINGIGNMSIDASEGNTIFIGTSNQGESVNVGNSAGLVNLIGNVKVNGNPIGRAVFS